MASKHGFFRPHLGRGFPQVASTTMSEGVGYDAAASALFARFTTPPTTARKAQINTLIVSLKAAGVWAKLDALYLMAAADAQAARRNWIADAFNLTAVSSPTFTADRGYAGDGSAARLGTGFIPSTAGGVMTVNSAHLSIWDRTSRAAAGQVQAGALNASTGTQIASRYTGNVTIAGVNDAASANLASSNSDGHFLVNRSGASSREIYRNGASVGSYTQVSVSLPPIEMYLLCRNLTGVAQLLTTDQLAAASVGASLTAGEALSFYNAVNTYLQAVGAA